MHEFNVMHGDFKTKNVLIKQNVFKIGDFGFAKKIKLNAKKDLSFDHTMLDTCLYMVLFIQYNNIYLGTRNT